MARPPRSSSSRPTAASASASSPARHATTSRSSIVLRSVLRFTKDKGHLTATPAGLPRLKRIEQTILEIPTDDEVLLLLRKASDPQRRAFGLMAYAGLRPNEVRALRRRDVQLRWEDDVAVGGFLSIREGRSFGQTDTPKTGRREVPIAPPLARLLAPATKGERDGYLALTKKGEPWGQHGLDQAFDRVRNRPGLAGWSVYSLRHYAITSWLRRGIPVHVVQNRHPLGHRVAAARPA
jgi:integrase